ncbi:MAG: SpoIIE family protein phosphatase [Gemmataceae bacterium]|nr:SpoIIE family protein phosphatase [Gemmataceae bacterium]
MQPEPVTVDPACPLDVVLGLMNLHRIGAVVVVGPARELVGIFTERDLLRRVGTAEPGWQALPVADWMTARPHSIGPEVLWEDAVGMMDRQRVRHLPVVEANRVIGIVSTRLLMGWRAEHLNRVIADRTRELRQSNEQLLSRDAELTYHLKAAGRFQRRLLLPQAPPDWPEVRWGVHYAPLDHLGGDYYDLARPTPDQLGVLIADASGHGLTAAMVAVLSRIAFAEVGARSASPGEVLAEMNARLQGLTDDRFVTAFYGVLDRRTRTFTYASAGHPPPYRYARATGQVQPLNAQGFLLGIMPGEVYRERAVTLDPGDRICFYTDGVVDARNEIGEAFGPDRLRDALAAHGREPADRLSARLVADQLSFTGTYPPADDVTLVIGELCEGASS